MYSISDNYKMERTITIVNLHPKELCYVERWIGLPGFRVRHSLHRRPYLNGGRVVDAAIGDRILDCF